jgi:hypothetical protein
MSAAARPTLDEHGYVLDDSEPDFDLIVSADDGAADDESAAEWAEDIVDAAIAKCSSDDPRLALFFALGVTSVGRAWETGGWPEVKQAARAGDPIAVELLCRAADLAGLS